MRLFYTCFIVCAVANNPVQGMQLNMQEVTQQKVHLEEGEVPSWVAGTLFINGPSVHDFREFGINLITEHFFDGLGGVTALSFDAGEVTMSTRIMESETFARLRDRGQYDSLTFATPMSWSSIFQHPHGVLVDNTPINLYPSNGSLFATSDSAYRHKIDPATLATTFAHKSDPVGPIGAAHPAVDPHTGEIFNYVGPKKVRLDIKKMELVGEFDLVQEFHDNRGALRRETLGSLWAPAIWIAHSVGLTEDYVLYRVLSERPGPSLDISSLSNFLHFKKNVNVQITAASRKHKGTYTMECNEAFSSFHIINSYTRSLSQEIVVDSVASDSGLLNDRTNDVFHEGYKPIFARPNTTAPFEAESINYFYKRCILRGLPLKNVHLTSDKAPTCSCSNLFQYPFELPVVNPLYRMKRHRFVWSGAGKGETLWANQIVKFDLAKVSSKSSLNQDHVLAWDPPEDYVVGEPRMIPAVSPSSQDSAKEDEGIITFIIYNEKISVSKFVVLNAQTMKTEAILRLPIDMPMQVHGVYQDNSRGGRVYAN